ncbi:MAG: hypothetical protein OXE58_04675 [Acidobacteria bacterium]|nr:hypothetical protein [Acidobacteriota bacterium]
MERDDRAEFFAFFLVGAALIVLLKLTLASIWPAPIAACVMVGIYANRVWDGEERRPCFDAAGDQTYYLGFLYTLASLAASLVQVGRSLGDDPDVIRGVLSGFGVAISSTILGMAFRVWLGRGEDGDSDAVGSTGAGLAAAGRRLRGELDYTVSEFREFRKRMKNDVERAVSEAIAEIEQSKDRVSLAETSLTAFESTVADATVLLGERSAELSRSAASLARFETAASRLSSSVASAADNLSERREEIAAGARNVSEALAGHAAGIADLDLRKMFADRVVAPTVEELRVTAQVLEGSVHRLREGWDTQSGAVEKAGSIVDRLVESMGRIASGAQNLADASAVMSDAARTIRTLDGHASSLGAEGKELLTELAEFRRGVSDSVEALRGVSEQLAATRQELAVVLRDMRTASAPRSWLRWFRS